MLINNILLAIIIFLLIIIFGGLVDIRTKIGNEEVERMRKFYKSVMDSVKKKAVK